MSELKAASMEILRAKKGFIIDMDGVIYHGNMLLPGVTEFVDWLKNEQKAFLFLTNSSERAPRELQQKLAQFMMLHLHLLTGNPNFYWVMLKIKH